MWPCKLRVSLDFSTFTSSIEVEMLTRDLRYLLEVKGDTVYSTQLKPKFHNHH